MAAEQHGALSVGARKTAVCGALVLLLAVSAYQGGARDGYPAVPVTRVGMALTGDIRYTLSDVQSRLADQREKELSLLDEVIAGDTDEETKHTAQRQKVSITERMETETLADAVLAAHGLNQFCISCGAGIITIFLPVSEGTDEKRMLALIDAVAEQTGYPAESVKIILVKNET